MQVVQAEIIAEQVAGKLQPVIVEKPVYVEGPAPQTEFVNTADVAVNGTLQVLNVDGQGKVEKIRLLSPVSGFGIILTRDGEELLHGNYADFQDTFAYQENSTYILELTDIHFLQNITLTLSTNEPVVFSKVFVKYDVRHPVQ